MSQMTGNVQVAIQLATANGQSVYQRVNTQGSASQPQTFPVFGNELITAVDQFIPVGGITVQLPNNGSGQTLEIVETSLSDNIATYTYTPVPGVVFQAGQNVSVINCVNGSVFNITNQQILNVDTAANQFTVAVTSADIGQAQEYVATATTSGISMLYLRNTGNGAVNVTWTPSGGGSEAAINLPAGAMMVVTFPNGNAGITALSFSSDILQSAEVTNVSLTSDVATLTTNEYHGFSVGQLVTTTGITNNAGLFNVTLIQITAVTNTTFSFVLVHGNVASTPATGASPEATVSYASTSENSMMEWAVLA